MPSIECKAPSVRRSASAPSPVQAPNSEITPSMSTSSSGRSRAFRTLCGSLACIQVEAGLGCRGRKIWPVGSGAVKHPPRPAD